MKLFSRIAVSGLRKYSQLVVQKTVPQPKGLPLIGTVLDLIAAGGGPKLHLYIDSRHKQLGPIFTEALGPVKATFIADPNDMGRVFAQEGKYPVHLLPDAWLLYNKLYNSERGLFFMNGEEWYKYRHIMNKIMLKEDPTEGVVKAYKSATHELIKEWQQSRDKPVENVINHMYRLSISYVIAALLGSSYPTYQHQLKQDVEHLASIVHLIFEESTKLNLMSAKMAATLHLPVWRRFVSAVNISLSSANKLVTKLVPVAASDGFLNQMSTEGISNEKIVSIVVDLLLASADTTPYTLVWALYLLAKNPSVQTQVASELLLSSPDKWLSHPILKAVMRETLRLYPAAPFLTRALAYETELSGFTVPAGEMIVMSLYTSGRCNDYFPEALNFSPKRWLREGRHYQGVTEAKASIPFAMGRRSCIGRKVAEAEIALTLAHILTEFHVEVKEDIGMILMLVPVPAEPVNLHLSKRNL